MLHRAPAVLRKIGVSRARKHERIRVGVGNEGVLNLFVVVFEAVNEGIFRRDHEFAVGGCDDTQIFQEGIAEGGVKERTVRSYAQGKNLAETTGELLGIAGLVGEQILLVARDGVEAKEKVVGVGAIGARCASIIGVAEEMKHEFAFRSARVSEANVGTLVAVVVILHDAAGIETREVEGPTESMGEAAASTGKAACRETAALRQEREMRRAFAPLTDDVDHTGDRVGAVQRALRATRDLHVVHAINTQRSKVEVASELIDLDTIDHHQVVVGIASADKNAGGTAVATGLANLDSRKFSQDFVDVLRALVFDVLAGDNAYGRADLGGESSSGRSGHDDVLLDGAYLEMEIDAPILTCLEQHIG